MERGATPFEKAADPQRASGAPSTHIARVAFEPPPSYDDLGLQEPITMARTVSFFDLSRFLPSNRSQPTEAELTPTVQGPSTIVSTAELARMVQDSNEASSARMRLLENAMEQNMEQIRTQIRTEMLTKMSGMQTRIEEMQTETNTRFDFLYELQQGTQASLQTVSDLVYYELLPALNVSVLQQLSFFRSTKFYDI